MTTKAVELFQSNESDEVIVADKTGLVAYRNTIPKDRDEKTTSATVMLSIWSLPVAEIKFFQCIYPLVIYVRENDQQHLMVHNLELKRNSCQLRFTLPITGLFSDNRCFLTVMTDTKSYVYTFATFSLLFTIAIPGITVGTMLYHEATSVSYTHLRAHETDSYLVCRLL